jgi:hypothetical protein
VPYDSVNTEERKAVWLDAGSPPVPALLVDGTVHSVTHPLELASLLGLAVEPAEQAERIGWDLDRILGAWIDCARLTPWEVWLEPTPSAGRSALDLGIDSFVPIQLLPDAWRNGVFPWGTLEWPSPQGALAHKEELNALCFELGAFLDFVEPIRLEWSTFLTGEHAALNAGPDREVEMARGAPIPYSRLLEMQRIHAAQHYRQVITHLSSTGRPIPAFRPEQLNITLPDRVY